jgi:hypothetical protein
MKSTGQARKHWSFPLTDCNYLPTTETQTGFAAGRPAKKSPAFHRLSSEFFGAEESRHYVVEFSTFTVLGLITAWPILSSIVAVAQMARGY